MRKKRTTQKTTETIKAVASKAADTVKETAEKVADKITEEVPEIVESVSAKAEEFMNSPVIEEGKEVLKETTEKATRAIRTRVSGITFEIFEINVDVKDIEAAVKKDVAARNLKGDIKIYVNAERRAAYYTVNDEGSDVYKIDLRTL